MSEQRYRTLHTPAAAGDLVDENERKHRQLLKIIRSLEYKMQVKTRQNEQVIAELKRMNQELVERNERSEQQSARKIEELNRRIQELTEQNEENKRRLAENARDRERENTHKEPFRLLMVLVPIILVVFAGKILLTGELWKSTGSPDTVKEENEEPQSTDRTEAAVEVPDVLGLSQDEAAELLGSYGLEATVTLEYISLENEGLEVTEAAGRVGIVSGQSIQAGTNVGEGTTVEIIVTALDETALEAYVVTLGQGDAAVFLNLLGYSVESSTEYSESVEKGRVISVSVSAGTASLRVSKGSGYVTIPELTGMTEEEAMSALEALGLNIYVSDVQLCSTYGEGTVAKQVPESGDTRKINSTVWVNLSQGGANTSYGAELSADRTEVSLSAGGDPVVITFEASGNLPDQYKLQSRGTYTSYGLSWGAWDNNTITLTITPGDSISNGTIQIVLIPSSEEDNVLDYLDIRVTAE